MHYKYPSIERLDKAVHLFTPDTDIIVQEKLDGSNFGFYYKDGDIVFQSRSRCLGPEPEKMFKPAIDSVMLGLDMAFDRLECYKDYIFYGEALGNGKIKYDTPTNFVLYDVYNREHESWLTDEEVTNLALRLSFATVPVLYAGKWQGIDHIKSLLGQSAYGNVPAEGVVVKAFYLQGQYTDKETGEIGTYTIPYYMGKIVTAEYQELNATKTALDKVNDPLTEIAKQFVTPARIDKAVARLIEQGKTEYKPHDIVAEINKDIKKEESDTIKEQLFKAFWSPIGKQVARQVLDLYQPEVV